LREASPRGEQPVQAWGLFTIVCGQGMFVFRPWRFTLSLGLGTRAWFADGHAQLITGLRSAYLDVVLMCCGDVLIRCEGVIIQSSHGCRNVRRENHPCALRQEGTERKMVHLRACRVSEYHMICRPTLGHSISFARIERCARNLKQEGVGTV
jgi:hypothetical protein